MYSFNLLSRGKRGEFDQNDFAYFLNAGLISKET